MNTTELELMFEVRDTMCDAKQAEYDYAGGSEQDEDIADWSKLGRIGAVKVG